MTALSDLPKEDMPRRRPQSTVLAGAFLAAVLAAVPAAAHPHVFVEARSEVVFDGAQRIAAVRQVWRFDEAFTAFAVQGLDENGDGTLSREELQPLARINVESLKEYDYFTFLGRDRDSFAFTDPQEYWLDFYDGRLTLFFTLPLKEPVVADAGEVTLDVYDPEYFVAFEMTRDQPFVLVDAPGACTLAFTPPKQLDPDTAAMLAEVPATERELPQQFQAFTEDLSNTATISCK